jgi:hypothetical protein
MDHRPIVNTLGAAAVIVVVLPMLAVVARSGIAVENGLRIPIFGSMGALQILVLVWSMAALAIVAALIALLIKDARRHA